MVAVRDPKILINPFDGVFHCIVPMATVAIGFVCKSNMPIIYLWVGHGTFLLLGFVDVHAGELCPWVESASWLIFLTCATLAAYLANLMPNFKEGGINDFQLQGDPDMAMFAASSMWLCLCFALAAGVNLQAMPRMLKGWQAENSQFSLSSRSDAASSSSLPPV